MVRKIAQQIAALPGGGAWQLDERLSGLLGWSIPVSARAIQWELDRSTQGSEIRRVIGQTAADNGELRLIAVFRKPHRRSVTGHVLG